MASTEQGEVSNGSPSGHQCTVVCKTHLSDQQSSHRSMPQPSSAGVEGTVSLSMSGLHSRGVSSVALSEARSEAANSIASFSDTRLLRGCYLQNILHSFGKILENAKGTEETYSLSHPTSELDVFISHNWSMPRWKKFVVLADYYNLSAAMSATIVCGLVLFALTARGALPRSRRDATVNDFIGLESGYMGALLLGPAYLLTIATHHEVVFIASKFLPLRRRKCFLDKVCIHQTNPTLKKKGIQSLGAYLANTRHLCILYSDTYLRKLWTVYELACFYTLNRQDALERMIVVPDFAGELRIFSRILSWFASSLRFIPGVPPQTVQFLYTLLLLLSYSSFNRKIHKLLELAKTRCSVFRIQDAECFCEDDRVVVENNIVALMCHFEYVSGDASKEEALNEFNCLVRSAFPLALNKCATVARMPYGYAISVIIPLSMVMIVDQVGAAFAQLGANDLRPWAVLMCTSTFVLCMVPLFLRLSALLAHSLLHLTGYFDVVYSICLGVVYSVGYAFIVAPMHYGKVMSYAGTSRAWFIAALIYCLLWLCVSICVYRCKCFSFDDVMSVATISPRVEQVNDGLEQCMADNVDVSQAADNAKYLGASNCEQCERELVSTHHESTHCNEIESVRASRSTSLMSGALSEGFRKQSSLSL